MINLPLLGINKLFYPYAGTPDLLLFNLLIIPVKTAFPVKRSFESYMKILIYFVKYTVIISIFGLLRFGLPNRTLDNRNLELIRDYFKSSHIIKITAINDMYPNNIIRYHIVTLINFPRFTPLITIMGLFVIRTYILMRLPWLFVNIFHANNIFEGQFQFICHSIDRDFDL